MIGGEFEIDCYPHYGAFIPSPDTYYYASGRSALFQILNSLNLQQRKIWLPDYLCHTIVEAVIMAGYEYVFFEVNDELLPSPETLDVKGFKSGDIVLIINYFGLQDLVQVSKYIKDSFPNAIIIEDDVQAFFCFSKETNPYADYRFTSLRKGLPVPDGGLVYTKLPMLTILQKNSFAEYKILGGQMKSRRGQDGIKDEDYLHLFEKGAKLIDENYDSAMSEEGKSLFAQIDLDCVKKQRQANARYLLDGLRLLGIEPLIPVANDKVPLFIPVFLQERNQIRRKMFANEVFCPVHWPLPDWMNTDRGKIMAEHELSLIVDQRYSQDDMNLILNLIN